MTNRTLAHARFAVRFEVSFTPQDAFESHYFTAWVHWIACAHALGLAPALRARALQSAAWCRETLVAHRRPPL